MTSLIMFYFKKGELKFKYKTLENTYDFLKPHYDKTKRHMYIKYSMETTNELDSNIYNYFSDEFKKLNRFQKDNCYFISIIDRDNDTIIREIRKWKY